MIRSNYILSTFTILFSIFFLYMTTRIPQTGSTYIIGPKTWPTILLVSMLILGITMLVRTYFQSKRVVESEEQEENQPVKRVLNIHMSVIVAVITGVYLYLLNIIGFIISSLVFIFILSMLLGMKKKISSVLLSIISTVVLVYLFSIVLGIPLPRGTGIFREWSILFY